MADNKDKTVNWLDEVRADAEFNYHRLLREQEEKRKHEESKQQRQSKQPSAGQGENYDPKK